MIVEAHVKGYTMQDEAVPAAAAPAADVDIPGDALHCSRCFAKAVVALDNCLTCLNCGESKCG